ncbi:hypothetical protein ABZ215_33475 [Amycolatopsis sp. NPDC006131]|uniref:hypothetical protein n=1 Tax=Amycolatopsis sp. NPDC006131 TaxID=3156731 RepID=UPI0033BF1C3B
MFAIARRAALRLGTAALAVLAFCRVLGWIVDTGDDQAFEDMQWTEADDVAANNAYWNPR